MTIIRILGYDTRINEAILNIGEESEKRTLSFFLTLRGFDMSELEYEIKKLENLLLREKIIHYEKWKRQSS